MDIVYIDEFNGSRL